MAVYDDFAKLDIRAGTIIKAEAFPKARKPACKLTIDFGPEIGIKRSSAQITDFYTPGELVGKKILGVVNFPPRQIADFFSEVLVLGTDSKGGIILAVPDIPGETENGDKLC
ncbi:MAG: tRNA-binding protein [Synergistaceae bacterium]|nr:tRNA-binding protein [Synergistaceae bacterium]